MTDARECEREALGAALRAVSEVAANCVVRNPTRQAKKMDSAMEKARAAIAAYGRAVREADKETARFGNPPAPAFSSKYSVQDAYSDGRADAAAAIEALEEEP